LTDSFPENHNKIQIFGKQVACGTQASKQRLNLSLTRNWAQALRIRFVMNLRQLNLRIGLVLAGALFLLPASAAAQVIRAGGSINGSVILPSGAPFNDRARVILQNDRGVRSNVYTDNRGRFQFNSLTPSIYEVVIEPDGDRFEIARAKVEVFPGSPSMININLKEKKGSEPSNGVKVISTGELDTAVPAQAKKEFERASEASKVGKNEEAVAHLRKAIALYPQYVMAHNDLGAQLLALGKLDNAAEEFRRAIQLDDKAFNPRLNLGIVLVEQHQFSEAAAMLKTALALESNSPAARLYNGLALAGSNTLDEAEREFKTAHELGGPTYAVALFHLGELYMNEGRRDLARKALQSYLQEAPNEPNATQARKLLEVLR
jgi:tetratricopeptide (TPR) repeat protein